MQTTIKAIETVYNGYRFRSRLEARWAVYFDKMGVKYEYEPEGYTFNDGTTYLPDFYLTELDAYVEIKHSGYFHFNQDGNNFEFWHDDKTVSNKYGKAINDLVDDEHIFLLLCGDPYEILENSYDIIDTDGKGIVFHMDYCLNQELIRNKQLKANQVECGDSHCKGLKCKPKLFSCNNILGFNKDNKIIVTSHVSDGRIPKPFPCFEIIWDGEPKPEIREEIIMNKRSAEAARQARFEHGECGKQWQNH